MNFQNAVKTCFTKYIDFSGRAAKAEFWWFVLFCFLVNLVTYFISHMLYNLAALILFLPYLAVLVRRLHDTNRSGWWALLLIIPLIGFLVIVYFAVLDGTPGPNQYGNSPPQ